MIAREISQGKTLIGLVAWSGSVGKDHLGYGEEREGYSLQQTMPLFPVPRVLEQNKTQRECRGHQFSTLICQMGN